jgi:hypothetical protein
VVDALDMIAASQSSHPDQPIGQAIEESLAVAWGGGLSEWVDLALNGAIRDSAVQPVGAEEPALLGDAAAKEQGSDQVRQARVRRGEQQVK